MPEDSSFWARTPEHINHCVIGLGSGAGQNKQDSSQFCGYKRLVIDVTITSQATAATTAKRKHSHTSISSLVLSCAYTVNITKALGLKTQPCVIIDIT